MSSVTTYIRIYVFIPFFVQALDSTVLPILNKPKAEPPKEEKDKSADEQKSNQNQNDNGHSQSNHQQQQQTEEEKMDVE